MKKLVVSAIAGVSTIIVATSGVAWYTGSQLEKRYPEFVASTNTKLKELSDYGVQATLKDVDFSKGIFSSDISYTLEINFAGQSVAFKGKDEIFHGPFPLNRLAQGSLVPRLLSVESHISPENEDLKSLFSTFAKNEALSALIDVSYSEKASGDITINPIRTPGGKLETSAIRFSGDLDSVGKYQLSIDKVAFNKGKISAEIQGGQANLALDKNEAYPDLWGIGSSSLNIKSVKVNLKRDVININDITTSNTGIIKNNRLESDSKIVLNLDGQFNGQSHNLGKVTFASASSFDAKAVNSFYNYVNNLSLMERFKLYSFELNDTNSQKLASDLLSDGTYKITEFSLENGKGKSKLSSTIDLNKVNLSDLPTSIADTSKTFKPSDLTANVNLASLEEVIAQVLKLQSGEKSAELDAKLKLKQFVDFIKETGLAKVSDKEIDFKAELRDGKVFANGLTISSEKDFQKIILSASAKNPFDISNVKVADEVEDTEEAVKEPEPVFTEQEAVSENTMSQPTIPEPQVAPVQQEVKPTATVNLPAACVLNPGVDELSFIQGCLKSEPNTDQILEVIQQAKAAKACGIAQRLYANKAQGGNARIAFAYAREYDRQFVQEGGCFSVDSDNAIYWYETGLGLDPNNAEARARLEELKR